MQRLTLFSLILTTAAILVACGGSPESAGSADSPSGARSADPPSSGMRGMMGRMGMMDRMDRTGMMEMMRNVPDGVAADELPDPDSPGAGILAQYCSQCHGIPTPRRLSAEEWPPTVRRMLVRMERMARMPMGPMGRIGTPSQEETATMLRYLRQHALRTTEASALPGDDPAAALFARECARCHALPDPAQYPADAWPGVVERMRENMRRMNTEEITDAEASRIVRFLQRAAGTGDPGT